MKIRVGLGIGIVVAAALGGCDGEVLGVRYGGGQYEQRIRVGERLRDYVVYVPPTVSPDAPVPLLLVFHGATMSAETMLLLSWLNPSAERRGFVVAYLQADGDAWATGGASPLDAERIDDLGFVDAVVERLAVDLSIDRSRVYAAGYSNGALFAERLACDRFDLIAAIGVVGASVSPPVTAGCNPPRPVPAVFMLGDRDPSFPWNPEAAAAQLLLGGEESASFWSRLAGCRTEKQIVPLPDVVDDGTSVERWDYPDCDPNGGMAFYRIVGGGHTWPGSPLNLSPVLGRKTRDIDGSAIVADFLLGYDLGGRR